MNFEEIMAFNPPYNQRIIDRLIAKIKSNCIVPYIGAGMSVLFDSVYPTWSSFLNSTYEQYFTDSEKEHYDSLTNEEKAQFLCSEMGRITFSDHLKDTFGEKHLDRASIDFLYKPVYILPVIFETGLLITTNYDRVIEKIYGLHEKIYTVAHPGHYEALNRSLRDGTLLFYKIHGDIAEPETSIILSKEQYETAYTDPNLIQALRQAYISKEMLFLGCSMTKDRPIELLCKISTAGMRNYAIIPCKAETVKARRIELESEYFTQAIIYPDGNHECLRILLEHIAESINPKAYKKIKTQNVDNPEAGELLNNKLYFKLPPQNILFTGREEFMFEVHRNLISNRIVIINGMSGLGKTQIAKQYAYSYEKQYEGIYWINANDKAQLITEYRLIASLLQLCENEEDQVVIERIKNYFENSKKYLLVYDNADDIDINELQEYLPRKQAKIIITTKNLNWDSEKYSCIRVGTFTSSEAKTYLMCNTNNRNREVDDEVECTRLIEELKYYPLALEHARAYINKKNISFSKYLDLFMEYRFRIMRTRDSEYSNTILTVFKMSFDKLREKDDSCIRLLALCSFLNHDNIPINKLFVGTKLFDLPEMDAYIENLMAYSMIEVKNGFAYTHRIIQEMMRGEIEEKNETEVFLRELFGLIVKAFPSNIGTYENVESVIEIISHTIEAYSYIDKLVDYYEIKSEISKRIGISLYSMGRFSEAIKYLTDYIECYNNKTITKMDEYGVMSERLAITYHRIGKSDEALKILFGAEKRIQSTNYFYSIAIILRTVGIIYKDIGKDELSINYHIRALELAEKIDDKELLINQLLNIGILYKNDEKYKDAMERYDQVEKILGEFNAPKLKAKLYGNKGYIYRLENNYKDSLMYFLKALDIFRSLRDESSVSVTLDHIGSLYIELGREKKDIEILKKSLAYYEEALELSVLNGNKFAEANILLNIGTYYHYLNMKNDAFQYFNKARELSERIGHKRAADICNDNIKMISNI